MPAPRCSAAAPPTTRIAFWAPREDLDEWEEKHGAAGWGSKDTFGLYKKLENNELPGDHHGHDGPVRLMNVPRSIPVVSRSSTPASRPASSRAVQRGQTVINGANFFQVNRRTTAPGRPPRVLLHPILTVRTSRSSPTLRPRNSSSTRTTTARPCSWSTTPSARPTGSRRRRKSSSLRRDQHPAAAHASGIGPKDHLAEVGIEVAWIRRESASTWAITRKASSRGRPRSRWSRIPPSGGRSESSPHRGWLDRPDLMMH